MKKQSKHRRKNRTRKLQSLTLSAVLIGTQFLDCGMVLASDAVLEFEGVTQISAIEKYPQFSTSAAELYVEEVYIESGSYVQEGQQLLKLTEDSYQEALDYYEASIIRAKNNLTDVEMEYEKSVQTSEYTLELARAEAEQAEFERDQSLKELNTLIEDHEEVESELTEMIEEVEEGIADGSYETSSSSGNSGSSSSSSASRSSEEESEKESEQESEKSTENDRTKETEKTAETEKETETESSTAESEGNPPDGTPESEGTQPDGTPESEGTQLDGTPESEGTQPDGTPGSEGTQPDDTPGSEGTQPDSGMTQPGDDQAAPDETEQPDDDQDTSVEEITDISTLDQMISDTQRQISDLETQQVELVKKLDEKDEDYNEVLLKIYEAAGLDTSVFCGVGDLVPENMAALASVIRLAVISTASSETEESESDATDTEESESDTSDPEKSESDTSDTEESESDTSDPEESESDTSDPEESESDTSDPEESESDTSDTKESESSDSKNEESESGDDSSELQEKIKELKQELAEEKTKNSLLQSQLDTANTNLKESSAEVDTYEELFGKLYELEEEREELYEQLNEMTLSLAESQEELDTMWVRRQTLCQEQHTEEPETETETETETESESEGTTPEGTTPEGTTPEGTTPQGTTPDGSDGTENSFSSMNQGNQGNSSMSSMTSSFSGTAAAAVTGNTQQSGNFMQGQNSESSLFGNSYDLTEAKNLLERTPGSTEDAEELLEQLKEALETVQEQYAELTRNKKATELEIQYTYDQAIIAGKLAEITYQQEMEDWEETLATAQNQVITLEEEKAALEAMTDGVLYAEEAMSIASVNYEAGDTLWANTAMYSYYDMNTLTVPIEVSQYDIAKLAVGETVEVSLSGMWTMEGTISSKSVEPVSGTSRTTVNYEVEISLDNSSGRLSSGVTATVTLPEETTEVGGNS